MRSRNKLAILLLKASNLLDILAASHEVRNEHHGQFQSVQGRQYDQHDVDNSSYLDSSEQLARRIPSVDERYLFKSVKPQSRHQMNRELGYARVKLQRSKMTLSEWKDMLLSNDSEAWKIKYESDEKLRLENKLIVLQRNLRKRPNDEKLKRRLEEEYGRSHEEHSRRRMVTTTKHPLSRAKNDEVRCLIRLLREDVEEFYESGELKRLYVRTRRPKEVFESEKVEATNPKYEIGDARASEIVVIIKEIRRLFHNEPLDPSIQPLWEELDQWMKTNQRSYTPIIMPTEYPNFREVKQSQGQMSHVECSGYNQLLKEGSFIDYDWLAKAQSQYPSKEAYIESLFYDPSESEMETSESIVTEQQQQYQINQESLHQMYL